MSIRDTLRSLIWPDTRIAPVQLEARQWALSIPSYQLDKPVWPTRNTASYRTLGYEALPVVYACVNARATAISAATVRVYRERSDGAQEDLPTHPVRLLLRAPNPRMSEAEFLAQTLVYMDVAGFALIHKERARRGNVVELWHLRPDWAKPIYRADGRVDWEYRIPGREVEIVRDQDVVVIPGGATLDTSVTGMSPIAVGLREIGIENTATDFLKNYFDHGGAPRYVITTPNQITDQAQVDAIRARFAQNHQGAQNWNNVGILTGGADIRPISDTLADMAYPELRKMTDAHICQVFGVPPVIIGTQVGLDAATYSNIQTARQIFYQDTITPLWARIDGALTRSLLPELEVDAAVSLEFDTTGIPALQEDKNAVWGRAMPALSGGGITLNQFQAAIGEDGFGPAGDVLLLPFSVTPTRPEDLPLAGKLPEPATPAPPSGDQGDGTDNADNADAALADRPLAFRADGRLALQSRAQLHQRSKATIARLAGVGAPKLRAFWRAQGERVINGVTITRTQRHDAPADTPPETRADVFIDWDDEERRLAEVLKRFYLLNGETAFAAAAAQLSAEIAFDLSNPNIRRVLDRLASRIKGIHETTMEDVRRIVADALDEGVTMNELSDRLTGLFDETYKGRSMAVARTESQVAYNSASTLAYRESGKVAQVEMLDNPNHGGYGGDADGLTCAQRDGMVVPLDQSEVHIEGTHINCILAVAPVLMVPLGEDA